MLFERRVADMHERVRPAALSQPEVREQIIDAAERLFRDRGYLKVTVKDIADELGMSAANVYRFFDSKATLRESLAERLTRQIETSCAEVADRPGKACERLAAMICENHRMTRDRLMSAANVFEMLDVAMRENWHVAVDHVERMRIMIRNLIEEGVREGDFKVNDVDCAAQMVSYCMVAFIDPAKVVRHFANDNMSQIGRMTCFILGALRSGSV
jgi:AcrR family transcriptional regulator